MDSPLSYQHHLGVLSFLSLLNTLLLFHSIAGDGAQLRCAYSWMLLPNQLLPSGAASQPQSRITPLVGT